MFAMIAIESMVQVIYLMFVITIILGISLIAYSLKHIK